MVTTEYKGVFFGYAEKTWRLLPFLFGFFSNLDIGKTIRLKNARCCIYWDSSMKGFMGLASIGPSDRCRIGPQADIGLRGVTAVIEVTKEAAEKWEKSPWS